MAFERLNILMIEFESCILIEKMKVWIYDKSHVCV